MCFSLRAIDSDICKKNTHVKSDLRAEFIEKQQYTVSDGTKNN